MIYAEYTPTRPPEWCTVAPDILSLTSRFLYLKVQFSPYILNYIEAQRLTRRGASEKVYG
jgi:hypothetical protein